MCELSKDQIEWGMERLDIVAKNWGVSIEKAVQILSSRDQYYFYQWVNADLFLSIMENKYYNERMEKNNVHRN